MKKRLLSILLTACLALSLCTGLSGTLQVQAAGESSIHINDLVQVQVGESLTDLKVYRNGVYEAMVHVEAGDHTATVFINGAETDMTTTFKADEAGKVCLRVKDNALTQVAIQSCALVGYFDGLDFVNEAGKPFDIANWKPDDPNAELTYLGGGLYGRTFLFQPLTEDLTIAGTDYKVAFNDGWDYSIGDGSGNIVLTIPKDSSSLTILVDEINQVVYNSVRSGSFSVAQDSGDIALPALATTVSLIGTVRYSGGKDWVVGAEGYEFDLISDTLYRYEKTFEKGSYEYKCVFDYEFWYAAENGRLDLEEKTHVVFLYDTVTGSLYDTVNDYNAVAELIGMQAPPAQTKISAKYLDENGEEQTAFCDAAITADNRLTTWGEAGKTTWYVVQGDVSISQGVTFSGDVHLILADGCDLTVSGGIMGNSGANLTIYGQANGTGTLTATGSNNTSGSSYGIYACLGDGSNGGNITISGGTVKAEGGTAAKNSCGIYADGYYDYGNSEERFVGGNITIDGNAKVTANGGTATYNSCGIYTVGYYREQSQPVGGNLTISDDAEVTAAGGEAQYSTGIYAFNQLTINGSTVKAEGGSAADSTGIYAYSQLTMTNSTVKVKGGDAKENSRGIVIFGSVTITGGSVEVKAGTAGTSSTGIYAVTDVTITGGSHVTVHAPGNGSNGRAMNKSPQLPATYWWRTADTDPFTASGTAKYKYKYSDTYVEFTDSFTITLDPNFDGGESGAMTTGADGKLTGNLPTPTRDGYTFDGWFTEAEDGDEVTTETVFDKNTTIYAHWTINQYTITFETDGGSEIDPITQDYGTDVTAPENSTKPGYTFAGWEPEIPDTMPAEDMTITAKWTKNSSGGSSTPTYAPTVTQPENGTVTVSPKSPRKGVTVTITPTPDAGYTVEQVLVTDKNGDAVEVINNGDGTYSFTQPAGKVNVEVTFMEDNSMLNFFVDVPADAYYYDAVLWAAENGITGGVEDIHFAPNAPCTRAQIVTFLWRAAGCPEPESLTSLSDVPADAYYAKAVAWAVENGITTGTGDGTTFSPNATCTRAQAMAFIYRSEQARGGGMQGAWMFLNPFDDVNLENYYGEAVMWAVANGVTDGTSDTTFSPSANCTRAQIVTFLYRCLGDE